ncbi:MAG: carboxypeptidase-like regulatory domain-containing protein [Candidatus Magasanikbacteria bacterium]
MKKILFVFFLISGFFIPFFVFAEEIPDQVEITNCLSTAYNTYIEKLNNCNSNTVENIQAKIDVINQDLDFNLALCYQAGDPEICAKQAEDYARRIQKLQADASNQQNNCREEDLKKEYISAQNICYEKYSFNNVWDTPVLKEMLKNQPLDLLALTQDQTNELSVCVQNLIDNNTLDSNSSDSYNKLSDCYKQVGVFSNTVNTFSGVSTVLDCSSETFGLQSGQSLLNLAATASGEQRQYLEQCVIEKLNPIIAGVAVLNVPFASGFANFFLYFQFLFTQPLLLLTKRKNQTVGKIFNSLNQDPVDLATVRLLDKENDKVAKTIVTGRNGEYLFLPDPGNYKVEVRREGFVFPSLFSSLKFENEYKGENILINSKEDVVNKYVPVDPAEKNISKFNFYFNKWKKRLAILLAFLAPLFAFLVVIFVRDWWTYAMLFLHLVLLFLFIRLSFGKKEKQYGRVFGEKKSSLVGVTVSLYEKKRNRLIEYYVTDMFGRYFLPLAIGEYSIVFEKNGFEKKQIDISISSKEKEAEILKIDVMLDKVK